MRELVRCRRAQGGEQAAPCGREPRCGMLELVRSRVAGGAGQCASLGLAAQLGGPGRGQVVADGGVHGGLLVVCGWWCWGDLMMRSAHLAHGSKCWRLPRCAHVDIGITDGYSPRGVSPVVGSISARMSATWSAGNPAAAWRARGWFRRCRRCHAGEILLMDTGRPRTADAPGGPCPRSWMW